MKYSLIIVLLLVGISHAFLGPISQTIGNIGNTVQSGINQVGQGAGNALNDAKGQAQKVIDEIINAANGIQFAAAFLWDNVFNPALDMLLEGGQAFLNDKLNALANIIGRPISIPENPLTEKYSQLIARYKSNIHHLYEVLFIMEKEALTALGTGEENFEEKIRAFHDKIDAIQKQLSQWAAEIKTELETHANNIQGEWNNILSQYNHNIDLSVNGIGAMFQQLTQNLIKNLLEVIPNATHIIEKMKQQGLLSFL